MQAISDNSLGPVHKRFHNPDAESDGSSGSSASSVSPAFFPFAAGALQSADYLRLARHIEKNMESDADKNAFLHPALEPQAHTVVAALRRMADQPKAEANLRAYHALRLLVP